MVFINQFITKDGQWEFQDPKMEVLNCTICLTI